MIANSMRKRLEGAAGELWLAQNEVRQIEPLSGRIEGFGAADAYRVAHMIHELRVEEGAAPIGRKIGFTNPQIWPTYGVYQPIWAHVYDTTVRVIEGADAACRIGRFSEPRIEPEIVVHFESAPPKTDDPEEILAHIDWVAHGFEIVQSHFPGWDFEASDAIADSGLHGMLVVGTPLDAAQFSSALQSQLEAFTVTLYCDGGVRDRGRGSNVLGSPLKAVAQLLHAMNDGPNPQPVRAGELITTGTLTAAFPIQAGQCWSTALEGIDLPALSLSLES